MKEIKGLKLQVNDLKESMEFTQNCPDQKVAGVEEKISTFEIAMYEMYDYQIDSNYVNDSLSELRDKISEM